MVPQKRFKLTREAMLLATISAAFPVTGYCVAAGHVEFEIGNVESVAANGTRHPLYKGSEINSGEAISTAAGARAQVRFTDGGYISLQPNTLFRVDDFNYQNKADGQEKGFFSLLKGGFRAITGVIGHFNKNTYRVKTPAATLGIRGTGYNMVLRDDGLFVNVGEGAISLNNNAGFLVVTVGGAAFVADFNTPPVLTTQQPLTPPNGLKEPEFTVSDNRDSSGGLTILPVALLSGPNYAMAYAYSGSTTLAGPTGGAVGLPAPVAATFSSTSQLLTYSNGVNNNGSLGAGTVSFSATDGIIGWGRWVNPSITAGPGTGLTGTVFDYVVGIPTAAMPTTGAATYTLLGYVAPTATDGSSGYTVNGTLTANFAPAGGTVGVNMTVANASNGTYTIATATPLNIAGANFAGTNIVTSNPNPLGCPSGCTTSINGFFTGTNAVRAGLSYSITAIASITTNVQGVAAFTR